MNINIFEWNKLENTQKQRIFSRSESDIDSIVPQVQKIIGSVRDRGDDALRDFSVKFDSVSLNNIPIEVTEEEFQSAEKSLEEELKKAIRHAIRNVRKFHSTQLPKTLISHGKNITLKDFTEIEKGVYARERYTPIPSAGLYVPRGRGSFPSMMIMMGIPASLAGVERIVVVTPPLSDGSVDAATLFAAKSCGIDKVYRIGGAHAIAALAYGTESIQPVKKIFGPGSRYVAAAKRILYGTVDIGLPAGPSESVIVADKSADCRLLALDLMIEAEHGSDSSALLITNSKEIAKKTAEYVTDFIKKLKEPRKTFVSDVLSNYGGIIITENLESSFSLVNDFAPEHLQLAIKNPLESLDKVKNAGEILLGQNTPFSLANYAIGPNAILPTGGNAKTYSPLSVYDFIKFSSLIYVTEEGRQNLSPAVIRLADYEGFQAHAIALKER